MLFETFPKLKLGLDFGQDMSTLNELIGYVDLTDCHKICQNMRGMIMNKTVAGNLYLKYVSRSDHLCNTSGIFLPSPALDVDI